MERERKPPAPDNEQTKYPNRNTEDERERKPNTRTREEIRETTIPRKDD